MSLRDSLLSDIDQPYSSAYTQKGREARITPSRYGMGKGEREDWLRLLITALLL
jgi:hypothetical protein